MRVHRWLVHPESTNDFCAGQPLTRASVDDRQHLALIGEPAHPAAASSSMRERGRRQLSVSYIERLLGCGCGVSAVSITRRSLAPFAVILGGWRTLHWPSRAVRHEVQQMQSSIERVQRVLIRSFRLVPRRRLGFDCMKDCFDTRNRARC